MSEPFVDPGSIQERRAAWLDRGLIRRVREMHLQQLLTFREQHCRLYHAGDYFGEGCWVCHLISRWTNKRIIPRARKA